MGRRVRRCDREALCGGTQEVAARAPLRLGGTFVTSQIEVLAILVAAIALFILDRWRYDVTAMLALLALALLRILPERELFSGFGNPAVITVAGVMIVSRALWNVGLVDAITAWLLRHVQARGGQFLALTGLLVLTSTLISDVGALAVFLPVALQIGRRSEQSTSKWLMPMAFSALLGGIITLIGTVPNILISNFRAHAVGHPFGMFSFTPVGAAIAGGDLLLIWLAARWLVPQRKSPTSAVAQELAEYVTEVELNEESKFIGSSLGELLEEVNCDVSVLGVIRDEKRRAPGRYLRLKAGDILLLEAEPEDLKVLLDAAKGTLSEDRGLAKKFLVSDEIAIEEAVLGPDSPLIGQSVGRFGLRRRVGVNMLAVARRGSRVRERLAQITLHAGDVLLLQGDKALLGEAMGQLGLLPLAKRDLRIGKPTRILSALSVFTAAVMAAASGWLSVDVAFLGAAGLMLMLGHISLREMYASIEWPIVILLGAFMPIGLAMQKTGVAAGVAHGFVALSHYMPAAGMVAILMATCMLLSNFINNAATAVIFAPVALGIAHGMGISVDPLLMAVAVGSCLPFLTPVGHQCTALVMTPGGYRFTDYARLGAPVSVLTLLIGTPAILMVWPLHP